MPPTPSGQGFSLLWPSHVTTVQDAAGPRLGPGAAADLDLSTLARALCPAPRYADDVQRVLLQLCPDPDVIAFRQAILQDLLDHPDLTTRLDDLLPQIAAADRATYWPSPGQTPLHEVVWRVGQLEAYVECVQGLSAAFGAAGGVVQSEGLRRLRNEIARLERDPTFQALVAELPDLIAQVRSISSVTIGVNLDDQLRPVEATLVSINRERYRGASSSLLGMLFGRETTDRKLEGIARLHSIARNTGQGQAIGVDLSNPMMYPLFRDLSDVLKQVSRPVASALQRYTSINIQFLSTLRRDLAFYLGAVRLVRRIQSSGLPMCRPEIAPPDARVTVVEAAYNINLALRLLARGEPDLSQQVVTNDIAFDPQARIFVLTGPNQGGKTTFTQAIGLLHVLAQAGLYVPGTRARISPVDGIYTHFPVEERPESEAGRLGEESKRLSEVFARATPYSLVLLNESLASTSAGESLYLAWDIVRILRLMGTRAIYATHLHELAARVDELNAETPGDSRVCSLVSLVDASASGNGSGGDLRQTYRIVTGPPRGRSYAREIAARYGISYAQLVETLRQRGIVGDVSDPADEQS